MKAVAILPRRGGFLTAPCRTGILPVGRMGFQPVFRRQSAGETPAGPMGKMPVLRRLDRVSPYHEEAVVGRPRFLTAVGKPALLGRGAWHKRRYA